MTICGCGRQAESQLEAVVAVRPVARVYAYDSNVVAARQLAERLAGRFRIEPVPEDELRRAMRQSDVVITCTSARRAFVGVGDVGPGCLVAAVGADSPAKQEIEPELLVRAVVVADVVEQCAAMGDLHHAIARGFMRAADVYGELGEIVAGQKPGRTADDQLIIFDSTGMALQDAAAAAVVFEQAESRLSAPR